MGLPAPWHPSPAGFMGLKFQPTVGEEGDCQTRFIFQFLEIKAVGPPIVEWKKLVAKPGKKKTIVPRCVAAARQETFQRTYGAPGNKGPFSPLGKVWWSMCGSFRVGKAREGILQEENG